MVVSITPLPRRSGGWLGRTRRRGLWFGLLVCAGSIAAATTARADFNSGWQAYQRGDFALAMTEWRPLAEQGHARAQYNMGVIYDEGRGVERSSAEAIEWWTKAGDQGNAHERLSFYGTVRHHPLYTQISTTAGICGPHRGRFIHPNVQSKLFWRKCERLCPA